MTDTTATGTPGRTASRAKLVLLVIIFSAPLLIAYALYYGGWRPESFVWRGTGELLAATGNALLSSKDGAYFAISNRGPTSRALRFTVNMCQPLAAQFFFCRAVILKQ